MRAPFASALLLPLLATCAMGAVPPEAGMVGVNLAVGEFGKAPGVFGKDYAYPGAKQFDYCQQKGLTVIRLPFKWERVQGELMGPLEETDMKRLDAVAAMARERGLKLILDMHNYARRGGKLIGTPEVPNAAFADVWRKLAERYKDEPGIFAYGIMNEPHGTKGLWPAAAQAAVDAIREVDKTHTIMVCGDGWSGAHSWPRINGKLLLRDPADNLVYEAHQYFDRNNSGTYKRGYDEEGAHPTVGVERLQPFVRWLKENNARGFIGEFGVPDNDARWLVVLDNALAEMRKQGLGGTYWAAGPWWGKYALSVEPRDGADRPQMAVLERYGTKGDPGGEKPWLAAAEAAEAAARRVREADAKLGKRIHDFGERKESYHYKNEESTFASEAAEIDGRKARRFLCTYKGNPAYIGVGTYFGALNCKDRDAFSLELRAEAPCKLEVKAYDASGTRFSATFEIGTDWQELRIPFASLRAKDKSYTGETPIQKIEFQPSATRGARALYFGALRLAAKQ